MYYYSWNLYKHINPTYRVIEIIDFTSIRKYSIIILGSRLSIPESENIMTLDQILAVIDFLGKKMTQDQADDLLDNIIQLSNYEIKVVYNHHETIWTPLYTDISMRMGEMGL